MPQDQTSTPSNQASSKAYEIVNRQNLARTVGIAAMILPFLLLAVGLVSSCAFDSISHYYYGPLTGTLFIGVCSIVALALAFYHGKNGHETVMARIAAASLLFLVLVPTQNVGCFGETSVQVRTFAIAELSDDQTQVNLKPYLQRPSDAPQPDDADYVAPIGEGYVLTPRHFALANGAVLLHVFAAGLFIAVLAYFCFFIFTKVDPDHYKNGASGPLTDEKSERNKKYRQSGWIIVACLVALIAGIVFDWNKSDLWAQLNATYVLETVAIVAFARSWLLKGRALIYQNLADGAETRAREICAI